MMRTLLVLLALLSTPASWSQKQPQRPESAAAPVPGNLNDATRQLEDLSRPAPQDDKARSQAQKKQTQADDRALNKAIKTDKKLAKQQAKQDKKNPAKRSQALGFRG